MRALEPVLGALLIAASMGGIPFLSGGGAGGGEEAHANAVFVSANYTGPAAVHAQEAAFEAWGAFRLDSTADAVDLRFFEGKEARVRVEGPLGHGTENRANRLEIVAEDHFENATLTMKGSSTAWVFAWPNASLGSPNLTLGLNAQQTPTIRAHEGGTSFPVARGNQMYGYELDGPVFALGNQRSKYHGVPLREAMFETLQGYGGLTLVLEGGHLTVQADERSKSYETGRTTRVPEASPARVHERRFAFVNLRGANASLDVSRTQAIFFAHEPTWTIDEKVTFRAQEGWITAGSSNLSLAGDRVAAGGPVVLETHAQGPNDESLPTDPYYDLRYLDESLPVPRIHASMQSPANTTSVEGQSLQPPPPDSMAEEATWIGRILGVLLLMASLGKKFLVPLVNRVREDPRDNDHRARILDFLEKSGLAHLRQIHRATGIPLSTLSYHLDVLREAGEVKAVDRGGYKVFFPSETSLTDEERGSLAWLANPTRQRIADLLLEQGSATQTDLAKELEISRSNLSEQLAKLEEANLVRGEGSYNIEYEPASLLRTWKAIT